MACTNQRSASIWTTANTIASMVLFNCKRGGTVTVRYGAPCVQTPANHHINPGVFWMLVTGSVWLDNQVNTTIMQNNQSMSTGPSEPASTEPSLPLPLHNPVWWTLTHSAAHSVPTMDKTYAAVKGSLSSVSRCLRWFQGPHRKEKLQVHTRDNICSTQTTTSPTGTCPCAKANIVVPNK